MEGSVLERGANEDVHEDCCGQGVGHDQDEDEFEALAHQRSLASGSPGGKRSKARPFQVRSSSAARTALWR